ncbi:Imm26 family immunity protein [Pseudomonas sp. BLCC-B13]|uniref:Imm26 family immunity protein n=1 Tax=Pseudomonas sp. BLCC-B13 TaxID=3025314 RepID=UPI00234EE7D3|nr:Imm26 family immunity protein [Pseudomonas sp. BLCC-B13]MDC7826262.1 Imm26 family immunity protein [Pseudomonas sp. BLCC-B13]
MSPKIRVKNGDIVEIPIDDFRVGFAHVIKKGKTLDLVVFLDAHEKSETPDLSHITSSKVALLGESTDALIWHGYWRIIGNLKPNYKHLPWPNFKVRVNGTYIIENYSGEFLREATENDLALYDNRHSRAPIGYQNALQSIHGVRDWNESYEKLSLRHCEPRS